MSIDPNFVELTADVVRIISQYNFVLLPMLDVLLAVDC